MNVLITSAGRRTTLLKAFKEAVKARDGEVIAGDMDALAPALYLADKPLWLPRVTDDNYIPVLREAVERYRINLIVPTIDTELPVLAARRDAFDDVGCCVLISDQDCVDVLCDKWSFVRVFSEHGIRVPASWVPDQIDGGADALPETLFVKPRDGSASLHTYRVGREGLSDIVPLVPNAIIQEYIPHPEITVDALIGFSGEVLHFIPRRRLKTVGGESVQGVTILDMDLNYWLLNVLQVVSELGGRGPMTLQAFLSPDGPILSEINPRFGGGFPLTLAAGGHYPEWILQMLEGKRVKPRLGEYRVGLYMTRYYSETIVEEPFWEVT